MAEPKEVDSNTEYTLEDAIDDAVDLLGDYRSSIGVEDHAEDVVARIARCTDKLMAYLDY